jgi:hypothetical protein
VVLRRCSREYVSEAIITKDLDGILTDRRSSSPNKKGCCGVRWYVGVWFRPGSADKEVVCDGVEDRYEVIGKSDCFLELIIARQL